MQHSSLQVGVVALVFLVSSWGWTAETRARPAPEAFPSEVASVWFDTLYDLVKTEQITPPARRGSMASSRLPSTRHSCLEAGSIGR
jgi:hypothetical protein